MKRSPSRWSAPARVRPYGTQSAEKIAYGLAKQGALVVSGAARGIDSAAHRGALRAGGVTVAVLGNGLDVVYPEENAGLYRDIAATARCCRIPAGNGGGGLAFSHPQPHHQRLVPCDRGGRSAARAFGRAHHRQYGARAGTRRVRGPRPHRREREPRLQPPHRRRRGSCERELGHSAKYQAMYPHKILGERVELPPRARLSGADDGAGGGKGGGDARGKRKRCRRST